MLPQNLPENSRIGIDPTLILAGMFTFVISPPSAELRIQRMPSL